MHTSISLSLTFAALTVVLAGCSGQSHDPSAQSDASMMDEGDGGPIVVLLPYPDGGPVEWDGWAGEFVADYCVSCHNPAATSCSSGSGCHPSAGPLPDFRVRSQVVGYAPMIRCGISVAEDPAWQCGSIPPLKFPVGSGGNPMPTDEQRAILIGWVDAGCP